jgi:hypothetical protein
MCATFTIDDRWTCTKSVGDSDACMLWSVSQHVRLAFA